MPKPYSHDLRSRALEACDEGERPGSVALRFRIGRASVYLWLKQRREEGRDRPKKMGGGPQPVIRDAVEAALKRLTARAVPLYEAFLVKLLVATSSLF
jgi:transposase